MGHMHHTAVIHICTFSYKCLTWYITTYQWYKNIKIYAQSTKNNSNKTFFTLGLYCRFKNVVFYCVTIATNRVFCDYIIVFWPDSLIIHWYVHYSIMDILVQKPATFLCIDINSLSVKLLSLLDAIVTWRTPMEPSIANVGKFCDGHFWNRPHIIGCFSPSM